MSQSLHDFRHRVPLRRILRNIQQGWSPPAEDRLAEKDEWAVLKLSAVKFGVFHAAQQMALGDTTPREDYEVRAGDLLLTRANTPELVGDVCYVESCPSRLMLSDLIYRLVLDDSRIDRPYAAYCLLSDLGRDQIRLDARGSSKSMVQVSQDHIKSWLVPLPPLSTQLSIANFLDRKTAAIDALIAKKERLIELLAEKRAALIHRAVTQGLDPDVPMKGSGLPWIGEIPAHWKVMQLRRQITLQRGVDITKSEQRPGSVPVVSSGGVASFHDTAFAKGPGVVVGRKGSAGSVHWVSCDYWPRDTTLYVRNFQGNLPRFVFYKLQAMRLETFDTGSANPTVNRNLVHPSQVSWPPRQDQEALVKMLDSEVEHIEHVSAATIASLTLLREYRQSLITAAVTGQLDTDEDAA